MAALVFCAKIRCLQTPHRLINLLLSSLLLGDFLDLAAIGGRICIRKQDLWLQSGQMDARICSKTVNVFLISHAISLSSPKKASLGATFKFAFLWFFEEINHNLSRGIIELTNSLVLPSIFDSAC